MSGTTFGLVVGVTLAVVAGVAILVPFAAGLLGAVGALAGYLIGRWRQG